MANERSSIINIGGAEHELLLTTKATKEIAERLFVSPNTVEFHRKNIMRKLGAANMAQLVKEGIAKGYIN